MHAARNFILYFQVVCVHNLGTTGYYNSFSWVSYRIPAVYEYFIQLLYCCAAVANRQLHHLTVPCSECWHGRISIPRLHPASSASIRVLVDILEAFHTGIVELFELPREKKSNTKPSKTCTHTGAQQQTPTAVDDGTQAPNAAAHGGARCPPTGTGRRRSWQLLGPTPRWRGV